MTEIMVEGRGDGQNGDMCISRPFYPIPPPPLPLPKKQKSRSKNPNSLMFNRHGPGPCPRKVIEFSSRHRWHRSLACCCPVVERAKEACGLDKFIDLELLEKALLPPMVKVQHNAVLAYMQHDSIQPCRIMYFAKYLLFSSTC